MNSSKKCRYLVEKLTWSFLSVKFASFQRQLIACKMKSLCSSTKLWRLFMSAQEDGKVCQPTTMVTNTYWLGGYQHPMMLQKEMMSKVAERLLTMLRTYPLRRLLDSQDLTHHGLRTKLRISKSLQKLISLESKNASLTKHWSQLWKLLPSFLGLKIFKLTQDIQRLCPNFLLKINTKLRSRMESM